MALVGQLAAASDYVVSAKVPAPIPSGAPVIISPVDGVIIRDDTVDVSGTCPVITPAIIVEIYDNDVFRGSVVCSSSGTFSVPIPLVYGANRLQAKVITITDDYGNSSNIVTITHPAPSPAQAINGQTNQQRGLEGLPSIVGVFPTDHYMLIGPDGHVVWRGKFLGGVAPYDVMVEWGDGHRDRYKVSDQSEQKFEHTYRDIRAYTVVVRATDANGNSSALSTGVAVSSVRTTLSFDGNLAMGGQNPFMEFVQKYLMQIYIVTFFSLIFLWYLEHGHHLVRRQLQMANRQIKHTRRHR